MNRLPTPELPGTTPSERLDMAFRRVLTVSKAALLRVEAKEKRQREKRKPAKKRTEAGTLFST